MLENPSPSPSRKKNLKWSYISGTGYVTFCFTVESGAACFKSHVLSVDRTHNPTRVSRFRLRQSRNHLFRPESKNRAYGQQQQTDPGQLQPIPDDSDSGRLQLRLRMTSTLDGAERLQTVPDNAGRTYLPESAPAFWSGIGFFITLPISGALHDSSQLFYVEFDTWRLKSCKHSIQNHT